MKRHYATKEANTAGRTLLSAQVPTGTVLAALLSGLVKEKIIYNGVNSESVQF
jgi:hypothetical protein